MVAESSTTSARREETVMERNYITGQTFFGFQLTNTRLFNESCAGDVARPGELPNETGLVGVANGGHDPEVVVGRRGHRLAARLKDVASAVKAQPVLFKE